MSYGSILANSPSALAHITPNATLDAWFSHYAPLILCAAIAFVLILTLIVVRCSHKWKIRDAAG